MQSSGLLFESALSVETVFAGVQGQLPPSREPVAGRSEMEWSNAPELKRLLGLLFGLLLCAPAIAGNWVVCDARIKVTAHRGGRLLGEIVQVLPGRGGSCFQRGEELDFTPETPDYQRMLPRPAWPKPGELATLRYRSLIGFCKGDGVTRPCTIEHHSILRRSQP